MVPNAIEKNLTKCVYLSKGYKSYEYYYMLGSPDISKHDSHGVEIIAFKKVFC